MLFSVWSDRNGDELLGVVPLSTGLLKGGKFCCCETFLPSSRQQSTGELVFSISRPEIGRGYPLNLSISLSGGKETNQDSPSNGE